MARESKVKVKRGEKPGGGGKAPAPVGGGALEPLANLRREIDRAFDQFGSVFGHWPFGRSLFDIEPFQRFESGFGALSVHVETSETDKDYQITAELPGMDESDIEVTLSDDLLTLKGEKRAEKEEKEKDYHLTERRYGAFRRSFRVPEGVDADKIKASFDKGVLQLVLPKTKETRQKARKIAIKKG